MKDMRTLHWNKKADGFSFHHTFNDSVLSIFVIIECGCFCYVQNKVSFDKSSW